MMDGTTPQTRNCLHHIGELAASLAVKEINLVDFCLRAGAAFDALSSVEQELADVRATLQNGLDRDKDDNTSTRHLAAVAVDALQNERDQTAKLEKQLRFVKSASEAVVDRAHTLGVNASLHRQRIERLEKQQKTLIGALLPLMQATDTVSVEHIKDVQIAVEQAMRDLQ